MLKVNERIPGVAETKLAKGGGDPRRYPYHQMGFSRDQRGQHTPSLASMEDNPIEAEDKITEPGFHPVWGRA